MSKTRKTQIIFQNTKTLLLIHEYFIIIHEYTALILFIFLSWKHFSL